MTKADLRSGMIVTCRNGNEYMILTNTGAGGEGIGIGSDGLGNWIKVSNFNNDLTNIRGRAWDIMSVKTIKFNSDMVKFFTGFHVMCNVFWTRPEKKKYTYEQIKEILGEEFEIVKEA